MCRASLLWKHLPEKCLVMFFKRKQIWIYLIKSLIWFLFTPHSSWGCRNMAQQRMDRWTQRMPAHLRGPTATFFLVFYLLWRRRITSIFQKGNWGTKTTIQHLQEFTRSQPTPFESSWRTSAPADNLSLNLSSSNQSQHIIQIQSPPNPCYL